MILDWGDSSIAHPFFSLVVAFRRLEWLAKLDRGDAGTFDRALRVGEIAHLFTWMRHRSAMPPEFRSRFDEWFPKILGRALAQMDE